MKFVTKVLVLVLFSLISRHSFAAPATLLFEDNFDRAIPGWTAVEPAGTYIDGPLRWQWDVVAQAWVENSNRYTDAAGFSPTGTAPMLINDATVSGAYTFKARLRAGDDDGFGLIFGYQDQLNFYRVTFARQNRTGGFPWMGWVVERRVNGVSTVLYGFGQPDMVPWTLTDGVAFDVTITVSADQKLTLHILDDPEAGGTPYELVSNGALPTAPNGKVGLMTWGMAGGAPPNGIQISNMSLSPTALVNSPPSATLDAWTPVVSGRPDTSLGGHGAGIWGLALGVNGAFGTLLETSDAVAANDAQGQIDFVTPGLVTGDASWNNYLVTARIIPGDDDGHGLLLRYKDELNHYRVALRAQTSTTGTREGLSVQKVVDGVWEEVFSETTIQFDPPNNVPYEINALLVGNRLDILIIANPTGPAPVRHSYGPFEITGSVVPAGKVGFFSWGMARTEFDFIRVQSVEGIPLQVTSPYGNPTPAAGLHGFAAGSSVTASVTTPFSETPGVRRVLTGFTGTGSVPATGTASSVTFTINEISSIDWSWRTEVQLKASAGTGGRVFVSEGEWFPTGTPVTISAQPDTGFIFTGWTGGIQSVEGRLDVTLEAPLTLTAQFAADVDRDSLPDEWEQKYFSTIAATPLGDADSDLISNQDEYRRGTNPTFDEAQAASDGLSSPWENTQRDPGLPGLMLVRDFGNGFRGAWENSNDHRGADATGGAPIIPVEQQVPYTSFEGPRMIIRQDVWQPAWNNSTASAIFSVADNDGNCVYFRYKDELNWYRVTACGDTGTATWRAPYGMSIQKRVNGVFTEIIQDTASFATDPTDTSWYKRIRISVKTDGSNFEVRAVGWNAAATPPDWDTSREWVYTFVDADHAEGRLGIGFWGQSGADPAVPENTANPFNPVNLGALAEDVVITLNNQEVFHETWEQQPLAAELPPGWTNPNTGAAAGLWQVTAHGTILESSNYSTPTTGSSLAPKADGEGPILLGPPLTTPNYFLEFGLHPFDNDGIGFIYDYVDNDNYSRVLFVNDLAGNGRMPQGVSVSRKSGGAWSDVFSGDTTFLFTPGSPVTVQFANNNGLYTLRVFSIDNPNFSRSWAWQGSAPTAVTKFGLATWEQSDAHFLYARGSTLPALGGEIPEVEITSITVSGGNITLSVTKPEGRSYTVEQSTTLEPNSWTAVAQNQTGATWTAPLPQGTDHAFWRIRLEP